MFGTGIVPLINWVCVSSEFNSVQILLGDVTYENSLALCFFADSPI